MLRGKFVLPLFFSLFFLTAASSHMFNFSATSYKALWRWYFFSATQNVLSLVELDLPIDWLSIIVVFEIQAIVVARIMSVLNFFASSSGSPWCTHSEIFSELNFPKKKLVELFVPSVLGDLEQQSRIFRDSWEQNFLWLFRLTQIPFRQPFFDIDSVPLISKPSLSSLPLSSNGFPIACFPCFPFEEQNHQWETFRNRRFKHCGNTESSSVLDHVFRESEKLWFGSLMSVVSSSTEVFLSNSLVWVICVCIWLGQVAKLLDASTELRVSIASRTGRVRQEGGQERDVEVSVQENSKDGWDTREKARWRETTDVQIPFYRHLSRAYMWHAWQCVKCAVRASCAQNNVCATKSMYITDTCLIVGLLLPLINFFTASPS